MNNFLNQNNVLHNLEGIVINKLNQMNYLLQQGKIEELIDLAHDIALILRSLKQNQRMIKLNQHMIQRMSVQLSKIDDKSWRNKVEKEQLDNFFHNLQHINDITNFNYMAMLRMKCKEVKVNNTKTFQFQLKPIGLENVGATCYMNATLQALGQIPELRDFFLYGPPRQEYDNRFINLINHWMGMNLGNEVLEKIDLNFEPNNKDHIEKLRQFCIERLEKIKPKNNKWDNDAIEELKLILKCFPDDDFRCQLAETNMFGNGQDVTKLPQEAIDIGYEFFWVLKNIDELEKSGTGKQFYAPKRFKDFLSIVNPLFKGIAANDSKDLVLFLYETWHKIYNKPQDKQIVANALKLDKGIYANMDIAQNICKQISNIGNSLRFLFTEQHNETLNNIRQCKDAILSCIENAKLDTQAKEWLKKTITEIINDILAIQDINCIPTLTQQLQWFSNMAYCYIAPSPGTQEFENFLRDYFGQNGSIVTDHFYHIQTGIIKCNNPNCKVEKTSYTMYNIIIFPLMKVYEYKNQYPQNAGQIINKSGTGNRIVTIQDCFRQFQEPEMLSGQNQIYCNCCNSMSDALNINKLKTLPQKMTLIFNRGKGLEFDVDIEHADYIDPLDILEFNPANYQCFHWINVRASILHLGESGMSGHFISAARSEKDNKPRTYNDAIVNDRNEMKASGAELSYVWFTDTMTLHLEIDTILEKVKNDQFRDAICAKFLSLGVLDAQEQNKTNKNRQMIFAYLLMYAFEKCMANKNLVQDQFGRVNLAKAQNFDKYLSDFICTAFNTIANCDHFNFDENNCQVTINQIKNWRQEILNCAQNASYVPNPGIPIEFNVYDAQFNNNIIQPNNNVINNISNIDNQNSIINNNVIQKANYGSNANLYSQNAFESPKYKPASQKLRTWLKFAFAAIFAVTTIVLIVLEFYLYALIPFVLMFAPFIIPKLCKSCCRSSYPIKPCYKYKSCSYDYNQDNDKEEPYQDNPNIIENNQI